MSGYNGQAQTFLAPEQRKFSPPQKWGYTFVTQNQSHVHARKDKIVIIRVRSSYTDTGRANSQNKKNTAVHIIQRNCSSHNSNFNFFCANKGMII